MDGNLLHYLKDPLVRLGHEASTAVEEGLLGKIDIGVGAVAKREVRVTFAVP